MEITLTKEQYETLIKLVYLGNWMVNAHRAEDDRLEKFDDLESYVLSFAQHEGLDNCADYDEDADRYYLSREFEESQVMPYLDEYDRDTFWEELIDNLSYRDFFNAYGEIAVRRMTQEEGFSALQTFVQKYEKEFETHGTDNLVIHE